MSEDKKSFTLESIQAEREKLQKEHELTNDEKAHLEEVSKEYMEQP